MIHPKYKRAKLSEILKSAGEIKKNPTSRETH